MAKEEDEVIFKDELKSTRGDELKSTRILAVENFRWPVKPVYEAGPFENAHGRLFSCLIKR
ncbi:hypothetical protein YC2023_046922 [Brassica napus]